MIIHNYNPSATKDIKRAFRHSGKCLDDSVVINVLYLLHEQRKKQLSFSIIDPLFMHSKDNKWYNTVKKCLYETPGLNDVVLMPLVKDHHWSLLVFLPSLGGYIHFDSLAPCHRSHAAQILSLIHRDQDCNHQFHEIALYPNNALNSSGATEQASVWECGYFVLMYASLFIDMKREALASEESLRTYMASKAHWVCMDNLRNFAYNIYSMVSFIQ